jgi:hypothetical protein
LPTMISRSAAFVAGLLLTSSALAYEAVAVANGGAIEGVVKLSAPAPQVPAIKTTKNQDYCGLSIPNPL